MTPDPSWFDGHHDCDQHCGMTYRHEDADEDNPYGPTSEYYEPVTWRDFIPVVVGLAFVIILVALLAVT